MPMRGRVGNRIEALHASPWGTGRAGTARSGIITQVPGLRAQLSPARILISISIPFEVRPIVKIQPLLAGPFIHG